MDDAAGFGAELAVVGVYAQLEQLVFLRRDAFRGVEEDLILPRQHDLGGLAGDVAILVLLDDA